MKCPTCAEHSPDAWESLRVLDRNTEKHVPRLAAGVGRFVLMDWMRCANNECGELVIRVHEQQFPTDSGGELGTVETSSWVVRPRFAAAGHVDSLVPPDLKRDYQEAAAILGLSPRMSAVLSRRILADLLAKYAKLTDFALKDRIDAFVADEGRPHQLRQNLGYLVEMGNFGAHTVTNDQAEIVDVDRDEAEWTLDLVRRLFDYFVVTPERDRMMREAFDQKLQEANRRPIVPPPDEES